MMKRAGKIALFIIAVLAFVYVFIMAVAESLSFGATITGGMTAGAANPRAKIKKYNVGQVGVWASATNAVVEETSGSYKLLLSTAETGYDFLDVLWMSDDSDTVLKHYVTKLWGVDFDESTGTLGSDDFTSVGISYWPGTGANAVTLNIVTSGTLAPIPSAIVMVRNLAQTVGLARGVTDTAGQFVAALDNGSYKVVVSDYGHHTFTMPETLTVSGVTSDTFVGTAFDPGDPSTVTACLVYGWLRKLDGTALAGKAITATLRMSDYPAGFDSDGNGTNDTALMFAKTAVSATTNASGYWSMELTYSARVRRYTDAAETRYSFRSSDGGVAHDVKVPSTATALFDNLTTYTLTAKP